MRFRSYIAVMLIVVIKLSCIPVAAERETKGEIVIRTGPGMTYDEERTLPADTKLKALELERKGEYLARVVLHVPIRFAKRISHRESVFRGGAGL